MRAVLEIGY